MILTGNKSYCFLSHSVSVDGIPLKSCVGWELREKGTGDPGFESPHPYICSQSPITSAQGTWHLLLTWGQQACIWCRHNCSQNLCTHTKIIIFRDKSQQTQTLCWQSIIWFPRKWVHRTEMNNQEDTGGRAEVAKRILAMSVPWNRNLES